MEHLPFDMQQSCISYKRWKKLVKYSPRIHPDLLQNMLLDEMRRVERCFVGTVRIDNNNSRCRLLFFDCKCLSSTPDSGAQEGLKDVFRFAKLNAKCVYKICKKIDKRMQMRAMLPWLDSIKRAHIFSFLGSATLARLTHIFDGSVDRTCPICLEEYTQGVCTDCGHTLCLECFKELLCINSRKGTLHNLVVTALQTRPVQCPLCRYSKPFHHFDAHSLIGFDNQRARSLLTQVLCPSQST